MYDRVFLNGNVITLNENEDRAEWVAVADGKIAEVGCGEAPEAKDIVDLNGATVLPGLFDAHCHVMTTGFALLSPDLSEVTSVQEALDVMKEACSAPGDEWVFGAMYNIYNIKEDRLPNCREIDTISGDHPVMIITHTLHGVALNSKALELVDLPDVEGIGTFEDGTRNGMLLSDDAAFAAQSQVFAMIPEEKVFDYIKVCADYAVSKGATTIIGLMGQFMEGDKDVELAVTRGDELSAHIEIFYQTWNLDDVKKYNLPRIGGCLTLDGAGFEHTMALCEGYPDLPERRGFLIHTDQEIYQLISQAHREGIQTAFHALGDRAIDQLLYIHKLVAGEQGKKDLRHRVEHFSLSTDDQIDMLVDLDLIASMQPAFAGLWGDPVGGVYEKMLGRERADMMERFGEIVRRGAIICGGSDSPVTLIDPLFGIASCICNKDPRRNTSVTDALRIFTSNAAYSVHLDDRKGTIEVGKDADLTVIDKDPYEIGADPEIYNIKPLLTIRDGEIIYKAE